MPLAQYLHTYFVPKAQFAELAGLSSTRLDELLELRAIPCATYVCSENAIESSAFGRIEGHTSVPGEYFRPECARWAKIADQAGPGLEQRSVLDVLGHELMLALTTCGQTPAAAQVKIEAYIPSFLDGTFGLCVADPASGAGIARKELLQERLTSLTDNGTCPAPAAITRIELLQLIDDYAAAAMPFSPADYPRSSRKRLVDDLRPTVACVVD